MGRAKHLRTHLVRHVGPCWVTQWVFDRLQLVDADFYAWLKDRLFWKNGIPVPKGDPCLSCPPFEVIEIAVLGGLVQASFPIADEIRALVEKNPEAALKVKAEAIVKRQLEGVALGIKALRKSMAQSAKEIQALVG